MKTVKSLYVVIVGCGRLGALLANKLSQAGHSVVAVDVDEQAFNGLAAEYSGFRVEGDATELAVLKQAKTDKANLLIATTADDNINMMIVQVAKTAFGVDRVMARLFEPRREALYGHLGVKTVCPTRIAADMLLEAAAEEDKE